MDLTSELKKKFQSPPDVFRVKQHSIRGISYSVDGKFLASASYSLPNQQSCGGDTEPDQPDRVLILDVDQGGKELASHTDAAWRAVFSCDSKFCIAEAKDWVSLYVYAKDTSNPFKDKVKIIPTQQSAVYDIAPHPTNPKVVATSSYMSGDDTVKLFDITTGAVQHIFGNSTTAPGMSLYMDFSPSGDFLAAGNYGKFSLYDCCPSRKKATIVAEYGSSVVEQTHIRVSFAQDPVNANKRFCTAGFGQLLIWRIVDAGGSGDFTLLLERHIVSNIPGMNGTTTVIPFQHDGVFCSMRCNSLRIVDWQDDPNNSSSPSAATQAIPFSRCIDEVQRFVRGTISWTAVNHKKKHLAVCLGPIGSSIPRKPAEEGIYVFSFSKPQHLYSSQQQQQQQQSKNHPSSASSCSYCDQYQEDLLRKRHELAQVQADLSLEREKSKRLAQQLECRDSEMEEIKQEKEGQSQQHQQLLNQQAARLREFQATINSLNEKVKAQENEMAQLREENRKFSGGDSTGGGFSSTSSFNASSSNNNNNAETVIQLARAEEKCKALEAALTKSEEQLKKSEEKNEKLMAKLLG